MEVHCCSQGGKIWSAVNKIKSYFKPNPFPDPLDKEVYIRGGQERVGSFPGLVVYFVNCFLILALRKWLVKYCNIINVA